MCARTRGAEGILHSFTICESELPPRACEQTRHATCKTPGATADFDTVSQRQLCTLAYTSFSIRLNVSSMAKQVNEYA